MTLVSQAEIEAEQAQFYKDFKAELRPELAASRIRSRRFIKATHGRNVR